jgi:serine/threonine protein phosphatase 1
MGYLLKLYIFLKGENSMTYVMSDIHGQYQMFLKMLTKINFTDKDTLYILGDIIDRGPEPLEIYEYIKDKPNIIMIMGNHEKMMINSYDKTLNKMLRTYNHNLWIGNGGNVTEKTLFTKSEEKQQEIISFFSTLPYYKIIEVNNQKYILCHAKPIICKDNPIEQELQANIDDETILWAREISCHRLNNGYKIIHGHTPVQYAFGTDRMIAYNHGEIINIDCGCAIPYSLGCLRLEDLEQYYVDIII